MSLVSDNKERKCASDRLYSGCCPGDWARSRQIGTDGSKSVPNMQKKVFFREPQLQRKSLGLGCHNLDDCPPSATNKSYPVFKLTPIYKLASFQRKTQPAPGLPGARGVAATGPADKSTRGLPHRKSNLKAQNQNPQAQITISLRCV